MDRKISKDQQRSTFGEWIFTRRPRYFLASDNTFPEFFLKGDLLFQE